MTEKKNLQKIPGFSQGVRENSAVRMLKMMRPICPNSQVEYDITTDGRKVPKPKALAEQNCQLAGPGWWDDCVARGHDPYFTTTITYKKMDEVDENGRVTGQIVNREEHRRPNIAQVAVNRRINSGRGAVIAIEKKGFRRLEDFGFEEVCQFRNCQKPVDPRVRSKAYGNYCSPLHLQLIAADQQGEALRYLGPWDGEYAERFKQQRAEQLRKAGAFAADQ